MSIAVPLILSLLQVTPAEGRAEVLAKPEPAVSAPDKPAIALPIREVTVYSDRARVVRSGEVPLSNGQQRVRLPQIPATADPSSVRLEVQNASVARIEVRRADLGELPVGEAEKLLREIEAARDQEAALEQKRQTIAAEREMLESLRPTSSPILDAKAQPALLETGGWRTALSFLETRAAADADQERSLEQQLRTLRRRLEQLCAKAQQMAAGANGVPGWVVEALLDGRGANARLSLAYLAANARWYPAYDVRYTPGASDVEVDFAGLVSQETGEDWTDARLVLSSAIPATTTSVPKLPAWKIGEKDQFIPTPFPKPEELPPVLPLPMPRPVPASRNSERLRQALVAAAQVGIQQPAMNGELQFLDDSVQGYLSKPSGAYAESKKKDKGGRKAANAPAPQRSRPPAPPPMAPAAAPPPMEREMPAAKVASEVAVSRPSSLLGKSRSEPTEGVSFSAVRGWQMPSYSGDLPAALAGGYDFTYTSARPESVRSGGEARRVGLHAARFPARALVTIFPALKKQAYLVAEVSNNSDKPLLSGSANLFVGADLQGQAKLPTIAVGEKLTLPLGIDEGIQIERNVNVVTKETGLISKDDVTTYEVVIELLNPRGAAVEAKVTDQIPLKGDRYVEVALDRMEPQAILTKEEGTLEWQLPLKGGAKQVIKFAYTVTRPRNAKLRQW